MKCIVTGATGFVGSNLTKSLLNDGHQVRALVRSPNQKQFLSDRIESVIGDVLNPESLEAALAGADVVFHCAAAVGNHFSKKQIYQVNLEGVRNVLNAIKLKSTRLILVSSINVLGTRNLINATEEEPYRYSSDPAADVKIEAEKLAMSYYRQYGVPVTIIRPGFIYGPGDRHNMPKIISALKRGKFKFIGSTENIVPIVHVDAVVHALKNTAFNQKTIGRVYHILDESRMTIKTFVTEICHAVNAPAPTKVLPYWIPALACKVFAGLKAVGLWKKPVPIAPNSLRFLGTSRSFDLRRAKDELGYHCSASLQSGLSAAIALNEEQNGANVLHHAPA